MCVRQETEDDACCPTISEILGSWDTVPATRNFCELDKSDLAFHAPNLYSMILF